MKKNRKGIYALIIIAALIVIAGVALATPQITTYIIADNECDYPGKGIRPLYFDCEMQNTMFGQLPEMPEDFYEVRNLFLFKFVTFNEKILDERYWKQPEWFPNFEKDGGALDAIKAYIEQSEASGKWRITTWCTGVYPSDFYAKTRAGRSITVYTWVRNAPHQFKYEGIQLVEAYPACDSFEEVGFELGNNTVCQNPDYVKQNIRISIDPNLFLLTPSFIAYTPEHTKIIKVDVSVAEEMEPGRYVVGFNVNLPSEEFNQEYYAEYGFGYTGSPREFHCAPGPQYRLFIDIEE
jgi:hypothetical protein